MRFFLRSGIFIPGIGDFIEFSDFYPVDVFFNQGMFIPGIHAKIRIFRGGFFFEDVEIAYYYNFLSLVSFIPEFVSEHVCKVQRRLSFQASGTFGVD